jgi:hypothetical protein
VWGSPQRCQRPSGSENGCAIFAHWKNIVMNQWLDLSRLPLLTILSTEYGHNRSTLVTRCAFFKLRNFFLIDQSLKRERLILLTLLSTENVENSAKHLPTAAQQDTLRHSG